LPDLISPFPRAECIRRLDQSIGNEWTSMGMRGIVDGGTINTSFRLNKRYAFRNDFRTFLHGKLIEEGTGTRIRCRTGVGLYVKVMAAVLVGVILWAVIQHRSAAPLIGFVLFGAVFGIARFAQQYDSGFLLAFVKQTLHASEVPTEKST
jgi:hypothetical protein